MTKEILAGKIKQLVNVTKELLNYSQRIKELHNKYLPQNPDEAVEYKLHEIPTLLRLQHCLYFYDVLLNLNSLLATKKNKIDKKEISFFELLELTTPSKQKDDVENILIGLREKITDNKMKFFRDKLSGHKDYSLNIDFEMIYQNFINQELLSVAEQILYELDKLCIDYFDTYYNNTFEELYDKGHQKLFDFFENELNGIKG